jgi:hypothetical protein
MVMAPPRIFSVYSIFFCSREADHIAQVLLHVVELALLLGDLLLLLRVEFLGLGSWPSPED